MAITVSLRSSSFIILALLISHFTVAQKNANADRARSLKADSRNKDARIVNYQYHSTYTFELGSTDVTVVNEETLDMISLSGNVDYVRPVFYNDNVAVIDAHVKYTTGKRLPSTNVCGHYEVDGIFYSDARICTYKFNFLHEGTEISFRSRVRYQDPRYLTKVFFHDELPVENRKITFNVPANVTVDFVERNFQGFDIKKSITETANGKTYTYTINQTKALKSESNSLGHLHHYPHILVVTKEFKTPAGPAKVISSVADLYDWYSSLVSEVENDSKIFSDQVNRLLSDAKTPEEKIRAIYYWVQDNIKYIAFEDGIAGFKPEAAQNVFTNRYGDCKGMANLTKEMLKLAGFDARLTWIGTNRIPYTYEVPTLAVDNHMICTVYSDGKQYILDPTEKYIALGHHAERIQGKEMLIENGNSFVINKVPVTDFNSNAISRAENLTLQGDVLLGQGQVNFNGESKTQILYLTSHAKSEDKRKIFDRLAVSAFSNADKIEIKTVPEDNRDTPLIVKYGYSLTNKVSRFDNEIYVDIDWDKHFADLKITEERETDYYFNRKVKYHTQKTFTIPPGYKVAHLPKGMSKKDEDFAFQVTYKQMGKQIVYSNEITVTHGIIKKDKFQLWNEYVLELKDLYNDQIVITKTK